jgi:peptidoglycan-associated lipoprotein
MRISIRSKMLLASACMVAAVAARGQEVPVQRTASSLDVAVTYNPMLANIIKNGDDFWMQGGSVQIEGRFWHGLGAVADVAGLHTSAASPQGVGLDLITATFGPRYTWSPKHRRLSLFGEALAGEVNGLNSLFPSAAGISSSSDSLAVQAGGGMNLPLTGRIYVRAFQADWLRTQLPNATTNVQNNLRVGAGLVFRFK